MKLKPWTRDDTLFILKLAPFAVGIGALIGLWSGSGWLWGAVMGALMLAEGPVHYLSALCYYKRHPNE